MGKPDGSIIIEVDANDKKAAEKLDDLEKKAKNVQEQLSGDRTLSINLDVSQADKEMRRLMKSISQLEEDAEVYARLSEAAQQDYNLTKEDRDKAEKAGDTERVKELEKEMAKLSRRAEEYGNKLQEATVRLDVQKERVGEIAQSTIKAADSMRQLKAEEDAAKETTQETADAAQETADAAQEIPDAVEEAEESTNGLSEAAKRADEYMNKFLERVKTLARRIFVFSLITKALRSLKDYMWQAIQTNDEAMASIAKLKGALRTLAQPIIKVLIPAFTLLVNTITRFINVISSLVSMMFGTTIEQSAEAAESLYKEQQALSSVGGAAKRASKSLASFDEINKISGDNSGGGSTAPDFQTGIQDQLSGIVALFAGAALLALGAILTFSGVNIPLGLGLMALGALAIWGAVSTDWDAIKTLLQGALGEIVAVVSVALLAIGAVLVFTGANIPLGLGMMIAGAVGLAATVAANWDAIITLLSANLNVVRGILVVSLLALGAILTFTGANLPLGIGLLIAGAVGLAATIAINWDTIQTALQGPIGAVTAIVSVALLAIGALFTFTGANLPLGIGLMIAGALGLAATVAANWDTIPTLMQGSLGVLTGIVSSALLVLGAVLLFTGAGVPLGLGLIAVGAVGLAAAIAPNWNYITEKLQEVWTGVTNWWNETVLGGLANAKETIANFGHGIIEKFKEVLGIASPSTETAEMGDYMMQGMANGITDSQYMVLDVFQVVLDSLQLSFQTWQTNFTTGFTKFRTSFTSQWSSFWNSISYLFVAKWNAILDTLQEAINSAIYSLNDLIREANRIAILTGRSYQYVMPITVQKVPIPKLATGAVIPPNREFLAVLGDQKQGTNIETPLSTMVQAFRMALSEGGGQNEAVMEVDGEKFGKLIYRLNKSESTRVGVDLTEA